MVQQTVSSNQLQLHLGGKIQYQFRRYQKTPQVTNEKYTFGPISISMLLIHSLAWFSLYIYGSSKLQ